MKPFDRGFLALGVFLGLALAVLFIVWFGLSDTNSMSDNQYISTIIGALVGGGIAIVGQLFTIDHSIKVIEKQRKFLEEATLLSIFVKLTSILDACAKEFHHQKSEDNRSYIFANGKPEILKPLSGNYDNISFSESEKAIPIQIAEAGLFNLILDSEGIMGSLHFLKNEYQKAFNEFEGLMMAQNPKVEGKTIGGEFVLKKTDFLKLSDLRGHLVRLTTEGLPTIRKTHAHLIDILEKRYGRKINYVELDNITSGVFSEI